VKQSQQKNKLIKSLRNYRTYHRWIGLFLALFFCVSALTGILLAWKKDVDLLQPPTQRGQAEDLSSWKSLDELASIASAAFYEAHPDMSENPIDRLDVRPGKGIVKVLLENGWWEVQIDGATGEVKSIARRHSDWIEALHDGSIVSNTFKLLSMNAIGWGLLLMIGSGIWLWYGPRLHRQRKQRVRTSLTNKTDAP